MPNGLTFHEQFTRTFDVFPFEQPTLPQATMTRTGSGTMANTKKLSSTTGGAYGFGSASLRFQNEVYGCHLAYGKVNKAVIELADTPAVDVEQMGNAAPSKMLPEYAAKFKAEPGRTFATTVSRDAPPDASGGAQYWVQPKDTSGIFPSPEEPAVFSMAAPKGAGHPSSLHHAGKELLNPMERREALVFDKCQQRARASLRKAANDACQVTLQSQRRFPNGIIGVEGPNCADSLVYAETRRRRQQEKAGWDAAKAVRYDLIASSRDSQLDYKLLTHDHTNAAEDRLFTKKAPSSLGVRGGVTDPTLPHGSFDLRPSGEGAHVTAFRSNQERPLRGHSSERAAALHFASTGGKPYDIISGATLTVVPRPADASAYAHDRRAHPSNLAVPHQGEYSSQWPQRGGTAPTLIGPIPTSHRPSWRAPSPTKSPSKSYMK